MRLTPLAALLLLTPSAAAQPYVWVEAEAAKADAPFRAGGWGKTEYLSGGNWLSAAVPEADVPKAVPAEGITLAYDLPVEQFGKFEVWARVGYEFARAPFRWRLDGGDWADVRSEQFTTDLMALADSAEVAWLKLGDARLAAGTRKLELHVPRPAKGRLLFGLDCVVASRAPFAPNGPHRPDADWQTPADRAAAEVTFAFPAADSPPAAGYRRRVSLAGTWQVARFDEPGDVVDRTGPIKELPDLAQLNWRAIRVPGDKDAERPELAYCHRLLYRCRVDVPADLAGRAFVLRFPNNALLTTVFVNGTRVGFSDTPCAAFECDATAAVKPGQVNEVVVGIKDLYYALAKVDNGKSCRWLFNYPPERFHTQGGLGPTRFADFPVLFKVRRSGILEAPTLTACGPVYVADVFAMPSVAKRELGVEVTVKNATGDPVTLAVETTVTFDPPAHLDRSLMQSLPPKTVTVPARGELVIRLDERIDPKIKDADLLWWPDKPVWHILGARVSRDGRLADYQAIDFGFREWGWKGRQFTLNGVPWQFRADLRHADRESGRWPDLAVKEWRRNGQNMFRFWGDVPWTGYSQRETLGFFDGAGIAVRRSGIFDGEAASYQLVIDGRPHRALFDNWRKQLAAWVKAERNHPSILIWSLENEITYTNARNFGWLKQVEPEIKKAAAEVMALDPTRPVMIDGGDALMDQSLPVAGSHYPETDKRDYPDEAYTLAKTYARHREPKPRQPWPVPQDRPLFIGESFVAHGAPPAADAAVIGGAAFLGRREAAAGVATFARMLSEGYRWHGVAAFHFWFAEGPDAEHYRAWQPVCVLCREWDTAFAAGSKPARTLKVFNDTRFDTPITVHWLFQTKNVPDVTQRRGKRTFSLKPGASEEFAVTLDVPAADRRTDAELVLSCERDGREVFRDVRAGHILPPPAR